jgi:hypothetical protein
MVIEGKPAPMLICYVTKGRSLLYTVDSPQVSKECTGREHKECCPETIHSSMHNKELCRCSIKNVHHSMLKEGKSSPVFMCHVTKRRSLIKVIYHKGEEPIIHSVSVPSQVSTECTGRVYKECCPETIHSSMHSKEARQTQ